MRPARRLPRVVAFVLGVVALGVVRPSGPGPSGTALAQVASPPDSALLLVFENGTPVAREHSMFQRSGDSLVVTASLERQFVDDNGARHPFRKSMLLVVDSRDLGLLRYLSNQSFNGHVTTRGLLPTDTVLTYYREFDGGGDADRLVQPPGRLFVLDAQMFTLFDVLCRSLAGKVFTTRRVQLLALQPDTLAAPLATLTVASTDTLRLGRRRVVARHLTLEDASARFELWTDANGRMLVMTHEESGLRVERAVDEVRPPVRRRPAANKARG